MIKTHGLPRVMNKQEILKKAIERAVENGYKLNGSYKIKSGCVVIGMADIPNDYYMEDVFEAFNSGERFYEDAEFPIIFSHDFAKSFWGGEWQETDDACYMAGELAVPVVQQAWKYHLQQMVIESDPLSYLEQFL